jgi:hypothetical protein
VPPDFLLAHDSTAVMAKFTAQWTNMLTALGSPLVGPRLEILKQFADVFTQIGQMGRGQPRNGPG